MATTEKEIVSLQKDSEHLTYKVNDMKKIIDTLPTKDSVLVEIQDRLLSTTKEMTDLKTLFSWSKTDKYKYFTIVTVSAIGLNLSMIAIVMVSLWNINTNTRADIGGLRGDINLVKTDINLVKTDVNQIKGDISQIKATQKDQYEALLAEIKGLKIKAH